MSTAFVLSGGGSLGAIQAGMLKALIEKDIRPDFIVGTSVGALNGAWIASQYTPDGVDGLAALWRDLDRNKVFPTNLVTAFRGLLGRSDHLVSGSGLRKILHDHLGFTNLEDAPIPFHTVATDVLSGVDVRLSRGSAIDAVLASAAIPGVLPPVEIDGHTLMDGGVVHNSPISHAVELGAKTVWVLPTGGSCRLEVKPKNSLDMVLHALVLTLNRQMARDVDRFEMEVDLKLVPPQCPMTINPADFSQAALLAERGYDQTAEWLARRKKRHGQSAVLAPHEDGIPA